MYPIFHGSGLPLFQYLSSLTDPKMTNLLDPGEREFLPLERREVHRADLLDLARPERVVLRLRRHLQGKMGSGGRKHNKKVLQDWL